jgi:hypothetical protein
MVGRIVGPHAPTIYARAKLAGQPLNVGRARRLATDAQRRAAKLRDRGCVFPGCDTRTGWAELHHIDHWRNGGATDLDNLACLCRRHHGIVHSNGWSMVRRVDATYEFHSPTGRTLRSKPAKRPPPRTGWSAA